MDSVIQLDLLDALEASLKKHRLHPALEHYQDEYEKTMEGNRVQILCKGWENAVLNENGVFTTNIKVFHIFPKGGKYFDNRMELHLALEFPYIHGELDVNTGAPFYYGRCSPVTRDSSLLLNVYDDADLARRYIRGFIIDSIDRDANISIQRNEAMKKSVDELVEKVMRDIA